MRKGYYTGGSYSYKYTCPVCGFVGRFHEFKLRWDGVYVCPEDWEPRNQLDFYRTLPDTHVLPRTAEDIVNTAAISMDGVTGGWTPSWTHLTTTGTIAKGDYKDDTLSAVPTRTFTAKIIQTFGQSTTFHGGGATAVSFPSNPVAVGTYTLRTSQGQLLETGVIPTSTSVLLSGVGYAVIPNYTIIFSGKYGI